MRDVRHGEREGAVPGPVVEAHEDQAPDAGGEEARDQDDTEERPTESGASIKRNAPTIGDPRRSRWRRNSRRPR